jgi:hypothetical protein
MKSSRLVLAAVLSTIAFGALADEADGSQNVLQFQGTKTRAEVQAELAQHKKAGVNVYSISYNPVMGFQSEKSRAEVQAELAQYKKTGVNVYSIAYNPLTSFQSGKTRAEVKAEYIAHRDAVSALHGEDSGSAYLAGQPGAE